MPNRQLRDPTGLVGRNILFAPDIALRSDMASPFAQDSAAKTLVIDYELLMKLPASSGYTATPSKSGRLHNRPRIRRRIRRMLRLYRPSSQATWRPSRKR